MNNRLESEALAKDSIANAFAKHFGCKAFGFCGGGGAMFTTDAKGKNYYDNGVMVTARILLNLKQKGVIDTRTVDPTPHFKKFPI